MNNNGGKYMNNNKKIDYLQSQLVISNKNIKEYTTTRQQTSMDMEEHLMQYRLQA